MNSRVIKVIATLVVLLLLLLLQGVLLAGCQAHNENITYEKMNIPATDKSPEYFLEAISSDGRRALFTQSLFGSDAWQPLYIYLRDQRKLESIPFLHKGENLYSNYAFSKNGRYIAAFIVNDRDTGTLSGDKWEGIDQGSTNIFLYDIEKKERRPVAVSAAWKTQLARSCSVHFNGAPASDLVSIDLQISDDGSRITYSLNQTISGLSSDTSSSFGKVFIVNVKDGTCAERRLISPTAFSSPVTRSGFFPYVLSGDGTKVITQNSAYDIGKNAVKKLEWGVFPETCTYDGNQFVGDESAKEKSDKQDAVPQAFLVNYLEGHKTLVAKGVSHDEGMPNHFPQIASDGNWIALQLRKKQSRSNGLSGACYQVSLFDVASGKTYLLQGDALRDYESVYLRDDSITPYTSLYPGSLISADGRTIGITAQTATGKEAFFFADVK